MTNLTRALQLLQALGFTVVGLDEDAPATVGRDPAPDGPLALVVGAEGSGISRLVREHCDLLVALPMRGKVQSLNASAALAAAMFAYVLPSRTRRAIVMRPRRVLDGRVRRRPIYPVRRAARTAARPAGVAQSGSASDL